MTDFDEFVENEASDIKKLTLKEKFLQSFTEGEG